MKLYGFESASHDDMSAWFHTLEAARRFAKRCGWDDIDNIATIDNADPADIMDTVSKPWGQDQIEEG